MKKLLLTSILLFIMTFVWGCGNNEEVETESTETEVETVIPEINDYYGAYKRSVTIANNIKDSLQGSLKKVEEIQSLHPSDYWKEKDFASIVLDILDIEGLLEHTKWLNETQCISEDEEGNSFYDWDATEQYVLSTYNEKQVSEVKVSRNSPNNYTIRNGSEYATGVWGSRRTERETSAIYDANHDWAQTVHKDLVGDFWVNDGMLEYGRQTVTGDEKAFVLQSLKERAYIVYNADGTIKNFAYSRLNGDILTRYQIRAFEILAERNRYADHSGNSFWEVIGFNDNSIKALTELVPYDKDFGKDYTSYNLEEDSIFTHIEDITADWVMELSTDFDQTIVYDGKDLTVQFYNVLSKKIEEYIIHEDGSIDKSEKELLLPTVEELMETIETKWKEEDEALWLEETEKNIDLNGDGVIGNPNPVTEVEENSTEGTEETEEQANDGVTE